MMMMIMMMMIFLQSKNHLQLCVDIDKILAISNKKHPECFRLRNSTEKNAMLNSTLTFQG